MATVYQTWSTTVEQQTLLDLAEAQAMIATDDIELQAKDAIIEDLTVEIERLRYGINIVTTRLDALVRP